MAAHISLFATKSLKAIDDWMTTCQGNLTGSTRNAFKETILMYDGGLTTVIKDPTAKEAGKMIAEQALRSGHTRLNWSEGSTVSSTQRTHFAISGEGFFLVQEKGATLPAGTVVPADSNSAMSNTYNISTGVSSGGQGPVHLTRDGEFYFGSFPGDTVTTPPRVVLLDKLGNLVLTDGGNGGNNYRPISVSDFERDASAGTNPDPNFFRSRPSVVKPTLELDNLQFSKYGSTYFQFPGGAPLTATTLVEGSSKKVSGLNSELQEKALESGNVNTARNITEMAALGKVYNGFVQLIKVYNSSLDEVLGFIR